MSKYNHVWEGAFCRASTFREQTERIEKSMKYRNKPVSEASSEQLLFELITRSGTHAAPIKTVRNVPHTECLVGIGVDETATITMAYEGKTELEAIVLK